MSTALTKYQQQELRIIIKSHLNLSKYDNIRIRFVVGDSAPKIIRYSLAECVRLRHVPRRRTYIQVGADWLPPTTLIKRLQEREAFVAKLSDFLATPTVFRCDPPSKDKNYTITATRIS